MAAATENLEEFFDFARLEQDHGPVATDGFYQGHVVTSGLPEDVAVMDWAGDMLKVGPIDALLPQDADTSGFYEESSSGEAALSWSLINVLPQTQSPGYDLEILGWHTSTTASVQDPMLCEVAHALTSSCELLQLKDVHYQGLPNDILEGPQEATVARPSQSSLGSDSSTSQSTTNTSRTAVPLRHAPSASWKPASAKRKGPQSRIPLETRQILEDEFAANPYPCSWEMDIVAHQANLDVKKVRNWFNNTRARKKGQDSQEPVQEVSYETASSLRSRLSRDSLEILDQRTHEEVSPPQPPLAVYLAQSYQEEAVEFSALQAAIDSEPLNGGEDHLEDDEWSDTRQRRRGSIMTSIASSEGTAPTTYTVSSSGSRSNISSYGRDRRRGRRRMAWKESPYTRQKVNGVNSAGQPQQDLPFFCTLCPRAFKTKYEWIRHEDSVHALRTTWICCDTKTASLQACPFCGLVNPDEAHMTGHKYQQCRNKLESQRTFYRRDHFVQHLHHVHFANFKHPSLRIGCQARLMAEEGHNFGCKDLAMKWRRFGAPMKRDDPMLHCGFCGKRSKDWSERCEHIAEHLVARELDRSVWWGERKENHLENLYSASPFESFRCRYCLKVFTDIQAMNEHSHCKVWSCRFLHNFDDVTAENAGPPLCPDFPSAKAHHCHLCGAGYRTAHADHAQTYHRYRSCNQEFYTSEDAFLQHLHNFHGASLPALLQGSSVIEQSFMRNKGASFEPVEFNESWQPYDMDIDVSTLAPFNVEKPAVAASTTERKDQPHPKKQPPSKKKPREEPQACPADPVKIPRQKAEMPAPSTEVYGPRFFRLSTYVPFRSSRIFYARNAKAGHPKEEHAIIEEIPKSFVASLAMSAGVIGMAGVGWGIQPEKHTASGLVELVLEHVAN